jgi:tripartite-type tricarboxylate transporter receptor subunit TctC
MLSRIIVALAAVMALIAPAAAAWPEKPVRFVIPFPAGGSTDVVGRVVAQALSQELGQQFVVDNRPGASGTLGSDMVAKSAPDGYTLLMSNIGSQGIGPALFSNVKYDTMADFTHIGFIGNFTNVLVANPDSKFKTLAELIAQAKSAPDSLSYATSGNGSSNHFLGELLKHYAGIQMVHIPYKGAGPALNDVLSNQIPLMFDSLPSSAGHIKAKSVRPLAVASAERLKDYPDVPTFKEAGFDKLVIVNWFGVSGPKGLPKEVVDRLSGALAKVLAMPELIEKLESFGVQAEVKSAAGFDAFVSENLAYWRDAVKSTGINVQ